MIEAALGVIERQGRWFFQRRDPGNPVLPGLWELPGGKLAPGESPEAAVLRELGEEVGVRPSCVRALAVLEGPIRLHAFLAEMEGEPRTLLAWGWFTPEEARRLPMPPANQALLDRLAGRSGAI